MIEISGYQFEGPYSSTASLKNQGGVYVILCKNDNGKYNAVDVGQASDVKDWVENHDRQSYWTRNCHSTLTVAVLYISYESERTKIEQKFAMRIIHLVESVKQGREGRCESNALS